MSRAKELREEFGTVFSGRSSGLMDLLLGPLAFAVLNAVWGSTIAVWGALGLAATITLWRAFRGSQIGGALGGLAIVGITALLVNRSGNNADFFLPGLASGGVIVLLCLVSVLASRPLAAWSSFITRRWPLDWYWHPQVLPAYKEVTWFWFFAFAARLTLEINLYGQDNVDALAGSRIILGWPFTVVLLVITYLYGTRRLQSLGGPSVEEFKQGKQPPWAGQRRGF